MDVPRHVVDLIDPAAIRHRFEQLGLHVADVRAEYVRHKPAETTIVGYTFLTLSGDVERGYVCRCERTERADELWDKAVTLKSRVTPLGTAIARLDRRTVFYPFPSDARLRRARWYVTPRKLKRTGLTALARCGSPVSSDRSAVEILRYKPERRVVAAVELVTADEASRKLLVRYSTTPSARSLASLAMALRQAGIGTPEPLLQLEDDRVSVDEFIDGIELRSAVRSGRSTHDDLAVALSRFHGSPIDAPLRSASDDLIAASSGLEGLAAWCPPIAMECAQLARDLARNLPAYSGPDVLLHGDLHDKNVMITADGVSFVDLERVARGPAAIDLGGLRGVVLGMAVREPGWSPLALTHADSVIDQYRLTVARDASGTQQRVSDVALSWHTAIALVDQALLATRNLEVGWQDSAETLLELARRQIATSRRTVTA